MTRQIVTAAAPAEVGSLIHVDPNALKIGDNVRDNVQLGKEFMASLAEHVVLVPITAIRRDDGAIEVRNGQRRTLGAREIGLTSVPVYILAASGASQTSGDAVERIVHQIVTNDHKDDLTDAQRARGIQQMIDAGISITKVAKKLSLAKNTVQAAEAVAKSATAMHALHEGQLSLAEAAVITEFEDVPGAVEQLLPVAGTRRFEHTVAQLREERVIAEAEAQATQGYSDRGFTILSQRPEPRNAACIPLNYLLNTDGNTADEQAVTDPAHWAVLLYEDTGFQDVETGEIVDAADVDWDAEGRCYAIPAEGRRHPATVTEAIVFMPEYFCLDYRAAALTPQAWFARQAGIVDGATVDLDAEARELARRQAETERVEAEKRERHKVLTLNKLGEAALKVRREFVSKLVARKTPPKGAATFVADCLARDSYLLTQHNALTVTAELLGVDGAAVVAKLVGNLSTTSDGRAQVITLALVLGALESRTPKDAWRTAVQDQCMHIVGSSDYLRWLANNDYSLAPAEEIITGIKTSEDVYNHYLAESKTG
ncbi:MAG: ParB N-terminal domain-containing protein [Mycobacteriaceae bacterium]|nr:ParB N-terminal domain-containing protein [Mycobacteriaceae bacterium]